MRAALTSGKSTPAACTCKAMIIDHLSNLNTTKQSALLLVLEAVGNQLALAHVEQPVQLPAAVLTAVKGREPAQFKLDRARHFRLEAHLLTQRSSSAGREKTQDCWNGQLPDDRTLNPGFYSRF